MTVRNSYEPLDSPLRVSSSGMPISAPEAYRAHLIHSHGYDPFRLPAVGDFPAEEKLMLSLDAFHRNARLAPDLEITPGDRTVPPGTLTFDGEEGRDPEEYTRAALRIAQTLVFPALSAALHLAALTGRSPVRTRSISGALFSGSIIVSTILEYREFSRLRRG